MNCSKLKNSLGFKFALASEIVFIIMVLGCVASPRIFKYKKISCPGAKQLVWNRRAKEPGSAEDPGVVIFKIEGVLISSSLSNDELLLGFHVPKGHSMKLNDNKIQIINSYNDENIKYSRELFPTPLSNIEEKIWLRAPNPYGTENYFETMIGETKRNNIFSRKLDKCFLFSAKNVGNNMNSGIIELPEMIVDDKKILNFKMTFELVHETVRDYRLDLSFP